MRDIHCVFEKSINNVLVTIVQDTTSSVLANLITDYKLSYIYIYVENFQDCLGNRYVFDGSIHDLVALLIVVRRIFNLYYLARSHFQRGKA
jgi:hypothetical protein